MEENYLEQTHHAIVNEVTGDDALKNSPYLPSGLPQGQSPEWHVNNPKESPLRHFRGDTSIKEYAKSAGDYYEEKMRAAGADDDVINTHRSQVEAAAAGKARQHALSQLENLGRQKEWAHWVEQALPFAGSIRQANREKEYQYSEDAFGRGEAGIGDYLTMGEKIGRMKQAQDETWYEKMGHIAAGGLAFAGEIGMTGGLGASAGARGAAALGGGKIAQLGAAGLVTTALRPTAAVEEYVRRGDKAPVMGENGQPLVDAKGNFQFAEPDSEGARLYKTALSQYIDNTIMPNLAGAFTKGTGSYGARVVKKTLAALGAGEASEELKYWASLAPESSDAHQLVFGGAKSRMEALKNLAIKTGGFGLMEAGTQGFHMADEAAAKKMHEGKIAEIARQDALEAAKNPPAPHDHPLSPAEQLRQTAEGMGRESEENPGLATVRSLEGRLARSEEGRPRADFDPLSGMPGFAGDEPEALPGRRGVGGKDIAEEISRFIFGDMPEQAGERDATLPSERMVEGARATERRAAGEPAGDTGGVPAVGEVQPPEAPTHPLVREKITDGHTPEEAVVAAENENKARGLKPPVLPSRAGLKTDEGLLKKRATDVANRYEKELAGVPAAEVSEYLQRRRGVPKEVADAAAEQFEEEAPKKAPREKEPPSPIVAKAIAKDQANTDAQVLKHLKENVHGSLTEIKGKINGKREKSGLRPLTDEQIDDSLMRHMDKGAVTRHRLSDGSFVYAHNEAFDGMKGEAKRQASMSRPEVTPQELKDDIEQLTASGRGTGSEAPLRRAAEVHLQKGIQDGIAYADERSGASATGNVEGASAHAVPESAGDKLRKATAAIRSLDETPTREALTGRHDESLGMANDKVIGAIAEKMRGDPVLYDSQEALGREYYYGDEAKYQAAKAAGEVPSAFAEVYPDGTFTIHLHTGNHIWDIAHEYGHGVAAALKLEENPKVIAAYHKEMANGQITHYSSLAYHGGDVKKAISEAVAEVYALLHDGGYTNDIEKVIPDMAKALKEEGVWPSENVNRLPGSVAETRAAINALRGHTEAAAGAAGAQGDYAGARGGDQAISDRPTRAASTTAAGAEGGTPESRTTDDAIRRASVSKATAAAADDLVANEPPNKPLDEIKQWAGGAINYIRNGFLKFGGDSFPATHQKDREAGEKVTEMSTARDHGQRLGEYHRDHVLGKDATPEQRQLVGAVGGEMRLRYARQNLGQEIEKAAQEGDEGRVQELRKQLDGMHDTLLGKEDFPLKSEQDFQNALNNPYVKQALEKYKESAKDLDKNYATYLGIEDDDINTLTQIPGMPMNFLRATDKGAPRGDFANLNNLRQKGSPFAKEASLSGKYNFDFGDMIENSFQRGEVAAKQAVANRTLAEKGLLIPANPGETKEGFANVENVRYRQPGDQVGKTAALIDNDVVDEYLRAKAVETPAGWKKISKTINQIPLLGALSTSVEGLAHLKNQLIANFAPGMSIVDTWKNAVGAFKGSDQFKKEMLDLSNIGAAKPPGEHKGVLEQLPLIGQALGAAKRATGFSLDPTAYMGDFIKRTDEVMRVSLKHAYEAAVPESKQTQQGLTDFINHWQFNYNKKAMPQILALAKESGIGPFAVASAQGKLRGISTLFGGHGIQGLSAGQDAMMRLQVYRNILTPIIAAATVNYFTTGRMDGGEDAPPLSIFVGTGDDGKKKYLDVGTLTGISPALRSLGLMAQIEGQRKGETSGDRIDKSTMDIVHALSDPIMGPGPRFAWTAVTGRDTYGKQVAGMAGYGESQAKKNLGAAVLHTNPTAASLAEGGKSIGEQAAGALGPFGFKYNEGKAPAVGQYKEALKKTQDVFNEARLKAREQGLKVQEPPELKALNRFSETINKYELAYHQKGITDDARQKLRAAQAKVAQTALQYFDKIKAAKP